MCRAFGAEMHGAQGADMRHVAVCGAAGSYYFGRSRYKIGGMPQTLSFNLVHVIFSTKNRLPLIDDAVAADLHAYMAGAVRGLGCECFRAGGVADHVHLAMRLSPTRGGAKVVSEIKSASSAWMKERGVKNFTWQRGYGMFSVGPADLGALIRYIDQQAAHHRKRSFQDEMRAFFEKYHVGFDERYVWD